MQDFAGGGTGFWSKGQAASGTMIDGNKAQSIPRGDPAAVIAPQLGTALVFGGDVTHAGAARTPRAHVRAVPPCNTLAIALAARA